MNLRLVTRASALARTQTKQIAERLKALHPQLQIEELPITTQGDREHSVPLMQIGGKGLFVTELENFLLENKADVAVHSLKDMPGDQPMRPELIIACTPEREDPRDALVSHAGATIDDLKKNAHVGTTSPRRTVQLLARRADLRISNLRGNVDTRVKKLEAGELDAIVLALAGIKRLNLQDQLHFQALPFDVSIPAVGQGTLALQTRTNDSHTRELLAPLHDQATGIFTAAERALLLSLRGNCFSPIGAIAHLSQDRQRLCMQAMVSSYDGRSMLQARTDLVLRGDFQDYVVTQAEELGRETANNLLARGARELIDQAEIAAFQRQEHSN